MMGYAHNNNNTTKIKPEQQPIEVEKLVQHSPDLKKSNFSFDQSFIESEEFPDSFFDSFLNFEDWVEDRPNLSEVMNSEENPKLESFDKSSEITTEKEVCESGKIGDLGSLIQEGMVRVRLTSGGDAIDGVGGGDVTVSGGDVMRNDVKQETPILEVESGVNVKNDEDDDSDDEDSDVDDDGSDDDDDDSDDEDDSDDDAKEIKKVKGEVEMEEGEIRDLEGEAMVSWSDDEDGDVAKGPIRSKNEVQDLPPVPPVNVTLEPHHQTQPVGVILSIIGAQVIVEGVENHNPLSEGSILWITESRSPLGVVDEIFGPVKNPYYIVRYNSESEVPIGIQQGSPISFVPEFADFVLNNNNLYKKGYDASGENDEELADEIEFSDDEKEAEYKKMLKMSKRGSSERKNGGTKNDKKSRNRGGNWKNDHQPSVDSRVNGGVSGGTTGGTGVSPVFSPGPQAPNLTVPCSGAWANGVPSFQPQNTGFPPNGFQPQNTGFPPNGFQPGLPFMQPNFSQQPFPNLGLPNFGPFHPPFNVTGPMFPSNFVQGVPPNFGGNPAFTSWPAAGMPPNSFGQSQGGPPPMAFQGVLSAPPVNVLPQGGATVNGIQMENNVGTRPPMNNGFPNRGGRKPFQRGGGRFRGGGGGGGRGGRNGQQSR